VAVEPLSVARLEFDYMTPAVAPIRRDDELRTRILDAVPGAKAAENPPKTTEWMAPMRAQASSRHRPGSIGI